MTAQGQQAQEIAKQSAALNSETEQMEEALMNHMENVELKKQELALLTAKN